MFSNLDIPFDLEDELLDTLTWRFKYNVGLKSLVVQSCRAHSRGEKLKKLVKVTWENVAMMNLDYDDCSSSSDACNET